MRIFRIILRVMFFIPMRVIFPVKVIGKSNVPKDAAFVAISNHLHYRDIALLWYYFPGFKYFLAKKELREKRITGFFLRLLGAIFIDRSAVDLRAIRESIKALKDAPLIVFPEGTRNKQSDSLQAVKGGAAMIAVKANVPLIPVIIHSKAKVFRKNRILIAPPFTLPYNDKDRFSAEAMKECTAIITDEMAYAKDLLDQAVYATKTKEGRCQARLLEKQSREAQKRLRKEIKILWKREKSDCAFKGNSK